MRTFPKWVDKIHEGDKLHKSETPSIYDLCFNHDGTQLIVAAGDRVLVYDPSNGTLIQSLKGHKDVVHCVAYSKDGKKFASGSADKTVIIWTSKLEGVLKYTHGDAIQCMAYNPISHQLASCAISDFTLWSAEQKAVQKYKSSSRINCCAWTNDGQYLALGLASGTVSIRNKSGDEKGRIDRPGGNSSPIWGLAWSPPTHGATDTLCIADWGMHLSFYSLGGQQINKERSLGFEPLCVTYFPGGEYLLVGGCNKSLILMTRDGAKLGALGDTQSSWVWCAQPHPQSNYVAVGCQDGTVGCYQLSFSTVHALYRERYAFRENMSDVIIQHLISGQKVRIKCRDLVHKIAIYRNRLAVQLPERVVLYELYSGENQPMHYKVKEKIGRKLECSLLVVCAKNLVLCQDKRLQSLNFQGLVEREWQLDSYIRYIKVTGGPAGREGLLLGLKSGQVWRIFLDNPLPVLVTRALSAVRCLDLSASRSKLAIVDDAGRLIVRDLATDTLMYQESNVNSVAWNTQLEGMLCYSGSAGLSVRVGSLPARPQQLGGVVVGLSGATAFCLRGSTMTNVQIPLSSTMYQFLEGGLYKEAYEVACLGVPASDWEALAQTALEGLNLQVAKDAFIRVRNLPWLQLVQDLQERQRRGEDSQVLQASALAWGGQFKKAARLFQQSGQASKALTMYSDLRMFDLAQEFVGSGDGTDRRALVRMRAEWARSVHEPRAAAELLLGAGESLRAVEIIAEQDWPDVLLDIGRRLEKSDRPALELIASHLRRLQALPLAAEIYRKLGEETQVVQLHVEARDWPEAFRLAENLPQVLAEVHLEHARWLAESDQFVEAHEAFIHAGRPQEAARLLIDLGTCAVSEKRYQDAAYFMWLRAKQALELAGKSSLDKQSSLMVEFKTLHSLAGIYHAFQNIHQYLQEPFRTQSPDALFNISRFLANEVRGKPPPGISLYSILFVLSKHARILGANKLALQVTDRLQGLRAPPLLRDQAEIHLLTGRGCPGGYHDPEDLLPLCYRCSAYSPHLQGPLCSACKHPFVYSYASFEILPLVEFYVEDDITPQDALRLLQSPPDANGEDDVFADPFADALLQESLVLGRGALRMLDSRHVLIANGAPPLTTRYFRNMMPGMAMTLCHCCLHAFHTDDYELQILQKGYCSFCRSPPLN